MTPILGFIWSQKSHKDAKLRGVGFIGFIGFRGPWGGDVNLLVRSTK